MKFIQLTEMVRGPRGTEQERSLYVNLAQVAAVQEGEGDQCFVYLLSGEDIFRIKGTAAKVIAMLRAAE